MSRAWKGHNAFAAAVFDPIAVVCVALNLDATALAAAVRDADHMVIWRACVVLRLFEASAGMVRSVSGESPSNPIPQSGGRTGIVKRIQLARAAPRTSTGGVAAAL